MKPSKAREKMKYTIKNLKADFPNDDGLLGANEIVELELEKEILD